MKHLNKQNVAKGLTFLLINGSMLLVIFFIQPQYQSSNNDSLTSSGVVTIAEPQVNLFKDVTIKVLLEDNLKQECINHDCFMTFELLNDDNSEKISYIEEFSNESEITIPASVLKLETIEENSQIRMHLELLDHGNVKQYYSNSLNLP